MRGHLTPDLVYRAFADRFGSPDDHVAYAHRWFEPLPMCVEPRGVGHVNVWIPQLPGVPLSPASIDFYPPERGRSTNVCGPLKRGRAAMRLKLRTWEELARVLGWLVPHLHKRA